ncbi:alpha/beta fold hydrolase [Corynebacterium sp. CCM 8835]|uniref:Alpha/beta fold hydrolase n=1 Tax=Corynebacterium antarcticum TaxID=2800405 RepID=A0A9Q4GPR1_9CORY|nr:alpha/beta fold hydrolase [Corynebacterium antarcticum]MCK7643398.1 alpha/beta fold hydrolase [Corynebacterium antarcticum]MCL0246440.1 alpha/beta fold hydrolase [Corynebacterium antarcticum]MCX7492581.1 alpha/beta fold hydrolase [Corynebacterium antarcticum]MCX7538929.1 alpha/beta fold hydrolase [Corynebacterium antarcticum]MCX7541244.1 alpha/beta fold hydrolase [Corynebacterium antarcticum]
MNLALLIPRRGVLPEPLPPVAGDVPVVLLHGTVSSPGNFALVAARLRDEGRRVIGVEYGHRGTDRLELCLLDIVTTLERELEPGQRFDIVGHSLGGLMGLRLAHLPEFAGRVRTLVGLGACFRGQPVAWNPLVRALVTAVTGPSLVQLMCDAEIDAPIPDGLRVISIVSDNDRIVDPASSQVGEVRWVRGTSHALLTTHAEEVALALADGAAEPHDVPAPGDADQDLSATGHETSQRVENL